MHKWYSPTGKLYPSALLSTFTHPNMPAATGGVRQAPSATGE